LHCQAFQLLALILRCAGLLKTAALLDHQRGQGSRKVCSGMIVLLYFVVTVVVNVLVTVSWFEAR